MRVLHLLFLLFIVVPLVEIWLLLEVGGVMGAVPTIGLVVLTAVAGAALVRAQGFSTIRQVHRSMDVGEVPAVAIIEGIFLLVAGALLLTPGFLTDADRFWLPGSAASAGAHPAVHRDEGRPRPPSRACAAPGDMSSKASSSARTERRPATRKHIEPGRFRCRPASGPTPRSRFRLSRSTLRTAPDPRPDSGRCAHVPLTSNDPTL